MSFAIRPSNKFANPFTPPRKAPPKSLASGLLDRPDLFPTIPSTKGNQSRPSDKGGLVIHSNNAQMDGL